MTQLVLIFLLPPAHLYFSYTTIISIVVGYVDIINPDVSTSGIEHMQCDSLDFSFEYL